SARTVCRIRVASPRPLALRTERWISMAMVSPTSTRMTLTRSTTGFPVPTRTSTPTSTPVVWPPAAPSSRAGAATPRARCPRAVEAPPASPVPQDQDCSGLQEEAVAQDRLQAVVARQRTARLEAALPNPARRALVGDRGADGAPALALTHPGAAWAPVRTRPGAAAWAAATAWG